MNSGKKKGLGRGLSALFGDIKTNDISKEIKKLVKDLNIKGDKDDK